MSENAASTFILRHSVSVAIPSDPVTGILVDTRCR